MRDFWSSVMMMSGRYKGQPLRAPMRLKSVRPEHFDVWLGLFGDVVSEVCRPDVAALFLDRARNIAASLQAGMFFSASREDGCRFLAAPGRTAR